MSQLALEGVEGVLPVWPSAMATVEAMLRNPGWLEGANEILDMGCGSGILGVTVGKLAPAQTCLFVDVNPDAVRTAGHNAAKNGLSFTGFVSDVWAQVPEQRVSLIICNPPFQPGGPGGSNLVDEDFRMHRLFFQGARAFLSDGGRIVLATCPVITGSREPELIAIETGWKVSDRCIVNFAAPSSRHPDRVHQYEILLLK